MQRANLFLAFCLIVFCCFESFHFLHGQSRSRCDVVHIPVSIEKLQQEIGSLVSSFKSSKDASTLTPEAEHAAIVEGKDVVLKRLRMDLVKARDKCQGVDHSSNTWKDKKRFRKKPARDPEVCFLFVSCNRPEYLLKTLESVYSHMEDIENDVAWESVLVDQSTPVHYRDEIVGRFQFDQRLFCAEPQGWGYAINIGVYGLCSAPFVAIWEDDWLLQQDIVKDLEQPRIFKEAMLLLNASEAFGVLFRDTIIKDCQNYENIEEVSQVMRTEVGQSRVFLCKARVFYGSFTNGAAVWKREKLFHLIKMEDFSRELRENKEDAKVAAMNDLNAGHLIVKRRGSWDGIASHIGVQTTHKGRGCSKGQTPPSW